MATNTGVPQRGFYEDRDVIPCCKQTRLQAEMTPQISVDNDAVFSCARIHCKMQTKYGGMHPSVISVSFMDKQKKYDHAFFHVLLYEAIKKKYIHR